MQKRWKEIVITILEQSEGLAPQQRAQLERLRGELSAAGLPEAAVEAAVHEILALGLGGAAPRGAPGAPAARLPATAQEYLQRLVNLGLIDEDQREELLVRARRNHPAGATLDDIQFLAASLIFDESLGIVWGWDGEIQTSAHPLH
ncbi:hypothetical protein FJ251_07460 [bacterium]|nr:hypothetical protein [bacterium]